MIANDARSERSGKVTYIGIIVSEKILRSSPDSTSRFALISGAPADNEYGTINIMVRKTSRLIARP